MTSETRNDNELIVRVITGTLLAILCLGALWFDGWRLLALSSVLAALMCWEMFHLAARDRHLYALIVAVLSAAAVWFSGRDEMLLALGLLATVTAIGWVLAPAAWRAVFPAYVFAIAAAGLAIFLIRDTYGFSAALWLVLIVVATDIAGYFVGRSVGGAKFWPSISPNKTWSGTIGGWVAAAIVSVIMAPQLGFGIFAAVIWGVAFSFVAQMGDIAESWVKRRAGVKDSSQILPGHGGVMDRFDGVVAVMVVAIVLQGLLFV
jgi:phosphatidate cytidylyltransferase